MLRTVPGLLISLSFIAAIFSLRPAHKAHADDSGDVINCGIAQNLSNSPGFTSADPFLVADQTGVVHLFWAERVFGEAGAEPNTPDALVYAYWDGARWSSPKDLFLSPPERFNKRVSGVRGVLTGDGYIHLVWIGPDNLLFYSAVHASQAADVQQWRPAQELATDQSGSQYSAAIAFSPPQTIHILYGRGISNSSNRALTYIRSEDNGRTWSLPHDLFVFPQLRRGASNVRLLTDGPGNVYATWTEWDETGNGQAVYFARSFDGGLSWDDPLVLDRRRGAEYERDWTTLAVLGDDQLVAFWEGGWRAYRQAQYSGDGGATWSEPIDTLDWLIADNGFAEFVRDSAGRLHLFVFQRVREGNEDKGALEGLWHTMWEGDRQWREPELVGNQNPSNFVTVDINNGNELFAAWFDYTNFEVHAMRCFIAGASAVEPRPWPAGLATGGNSQPVDEPPASPVDEGDAVATVASEPQPAAPSNAVPIPTGRFQNPSAILLVGILPALLLIALVIVFNRYLRRTH